MTKPPYISIKYTEREWGWAFIGIYDEDKRDITNKFPRELVMRLAECGKELQDVSIFGEME